MHCCTHNIFVNCKPITGQIYSDLPDKFLIQSSRDYNYLLVVYNYISNIILVKPTKNCTAKEIVAAYTKIYKLLLLCGLQPCLQRLDNKASQLLRDYLTTNNVTHQLAPPNMHRCNSAKRAIQTFQKHFIAILCGTDPSFLISS